MDGVIPDIVPVAPKEPMEWVRHREGFPLFDREDLPVDFGAASRLLKRFLKHLSETDRKDAAGLKKALERVTSDDLWGEALFRRILEQDDIKLSRISEDVNLDPQTLLFLGQTALKPYIHLFRESVSADLDKTEWHHGYCPFCGSWPLMAFFEKSGKRYLRCELCGEKWSFSRIKCPFCNTQEQDKLGYFEAEQEEGFRIYFCRECGRYIKTMDMRSFEEVAPPALENLATLHLDLLARDHDFH